MFASGREMKKTVAAQESRFAECRLRVADGCGGAHIAGEEWEGARLMHWVCCPDCPNRDEINSPALQPRPISRSLP
jgi:hypothetical protein